LDSIELGELRPLSAAGFCPLLKLPKLELKFGTAVEYEAFVEAHASLGEGASLLESVVF